jgi:hypothetical protein
MTHVAVRSDKRKQGDCSRRRVLAGLTVGSVGALGGCLGTGSDSPSDDGADASGDGSSADAGGGGGDGCPQWSSLSAYDVSGTDFVVVPSFPDSWETLQESYIEAQVEVGFAYPGSRSESGSSYPDNVFVTQITSPTGKDWGLRESIEQDLYDEADPVVIDGTEFIVVTRQTPTTAFFRFTAPGPDDKYYITRVSINSERESCLGTMQAAGRAVLDSLVPNEETTI